MENTVIKQVIETKNWFPGAFIDQHLSWKPHIGLKKISDIMGIFIQNVTDLVLLSSISLSNIL